MRYSNVPMDLADACWVRMAAEAVAGTVVGWTLRDVPRARMDNRWLKGFEPWHPTNEVSAPAEERCG